MKYHWNYTLAVEILPFFKGKFKNYTNHCYTWAQKRKSWSFICLLATQITTIHISKLTDLIAGLIRSTQKAKHSAWLLILISHHTWSCTLQLLLWTADNTCHDMQPSSKTAPFLAVSRKATLAFKSKSWRKAQHIGATSEVILFTPSWSRTWKYSLCWFCQAQITLKKREKCAVVCSMLYTTINSLQCPKNSMKILFSNYRIHTYLDMESPMHRKLIECSLGFISFNISALFNLMWLQQCQKTAGLVCADLQETL